MIAPEAFDWVASLPLTSIQKHILLVMICRGNGRRTAWPSQERLAAECSTSVATVKRTIKELVRLGYLTPLVDPERSARLAAAGISYPVFTVVYAVNLSLQEGEGVAHHELGGVAHHELQSTETLSTSVPKEESPVGTAREARPTQTALFEKPKRRKARTSVDPDWWPTEAGLEFAKRLGVTDLDATVGQFRDYHAAKGNLMADWPAAWRTWCRNDKRFRPQQRTQQQPKDRPGIVRDARGFVVRNFNMT
jgi:hypothetical protein